MKTNIEKKKRKIKLLIQKKENSILVLKVEINELLKELNKLDNGNR